ncbi:MAG: hypothetical protein IT285_15455 [Bdellovibrionales bacterium]|nr:hypothetical protein [Bdellovibrionales bacterium]
MASVGSSLARAARGGFVCLLALSALGGCKSSDPEGASKGGSASEGTISSLGAGANALGEYAGGLKGVKIIMKANGTDGSFNPPATGYTGTDSAAGEGYPVTRIFTSGGNLVASNSDPTQWPDSIKWLTSFEVGISGSANTNATDADCARFATSEPEDTTNAMCDWDGNVSTPAMPCGAPIGMYRVSETNCNAAGAGTGGQTDPIFIRFGLNRATTRLGTAENLLVIVEYAASSYWPAPADPTFCYNTALGIFDPTHTNCSDMSWQLFLKHSAGDSVIPFLTLIPPSFGHRDGAGNHGGSGVSTKQLFIPIAGDPALTLVQLSRIRSKTTATNCPDNSPLCFGTLYYSVTILRI